MMLFMRCLFFGGLRSVGSARLPVGFRSVSLSNGVAKRNYEHPQVATPVDASRFAAGAPAGRLCPKG